MAKFYVWPGIQGTPPAPLRRMVWLDSNTHNLAVPAGQYGAVFNPGPQGRAGWDWWASYFLGDIKKPNGERLDPIGNLSRRGISIDFIFIDIEWDVHKLPIPYHDARIVTDDLKAARTIVQHFFPNAFVSFHGDNWEIEHLSWTGQNTGKHKFFGWQNREPETLGHAPNYTNVFWSTPTIHLPAKAMKHAQITHWIEKAKFWKTATDPKTGQNTHEQGDYPIKNPALQREWGKTLRTAAHPVLLYNVTDFNHLNLRAFINGVLDRNEADTV